MRITNNQMYNNMMTGMNKQLQVHADSSASIASGTRFQRPSQAGIDYKTSLDLRHTQQQIQGSMESLNVAESRLSASQTMLQDITNVLVRAQTLAVQQASAQNGSTEHIVAAVEVGHLLDQAINSANQQWQGEFLFSGTAVDQQAFVADTQGKFVYNGSNQDRIIAINTSHTITSNVRGDEPAFTNTIAALQDFQTALNNNDQQGIANAISTLTKANNDVVDLNSRIGGQVNSVRSFRQSFDDMRFAIDKRMNDHESADIPALVAQMQQADLALQATYSQIANMKSLSLVNFLR